MTIEIFIGIILGLLYHYFVLYTNTFKGLIFDGSYLGGFLRFYGLLSLVFFIAILPVGIVGAIKLQLSNKISKAIFYSVLYWLLSMVVFAVIVSFFGSPFIIFNFIILIGIIFGFNLVLNSKAEDSN
jgi:hypothetical protein